MLTPAKLYFFTGKGGVGKTTASISFAKHLQNQGFDVTHLSFASNSLDNKSYSFNDAFELSQKLNVDHMALEIEDCAKNYMAKKLKSQTVAHWISKTPFFRALINMIPGFNYLIYMGKALELIHESKSDKIIVIDGPSSGHALTMLESTSNFQKIFRSGLIFEDTKKMMALLNTPNFFKIVILAIPTQLAITEAAELRQKVQDIEAHKSIIAVNNSLSLVKAIDGEKLPPFLRNRLKTEVELRTQFADIYELPYIIESDPSQIAESLVPFMQNLV